MTEGVKAQEHHVLTDQTKGECVCSEASPSEPEPSQAMEFYREADMGTVDTRMLIAQMGVVAESQGYKGLAQQEQAEQLVLNELIATYNEARTANDLRSLGKATSALR